MLYLQSYEKINPIIINYLHKEIVQTLLCHAVYMYNRDELHVIRAIIYHIYNICIHYICAPVQQT